MLVSPFVIPAQAGIQESQGMNNTKNIKVTPFTPGQPVLVREIWQG